MRCWPSFPLLSHGERLVDLTTTEHGGEGEEVVGLKRCLCVEDSVIGFGERLSDLVLGEAAQQKHGYLAPRISSDLRGEERCFCSVSF